MIKIITEEESKYLTLLTINPELKGIIDKCTIEPKLSKIVENLSDEEIILLNNILTDPELKKQMDILSTSNFIEYVKSNGYQELMKILEELSSQLTTNVEGRIERIIVIFDYINFLATSDEISKYVEGEKFKKEVYSILESIKSEIEEGKLKKLIAEAKKQQAENERLNAQNNELSQGNRELQAQNNQLKMEIEGLTRSADQLRIEVASLDRQIETKRTLLARGLEEEIEAERIKSKSTLEEERAKSLTEIEEKRKKLLESMRSLDMRLDYYGLKLGCNNYPHINFPQSYEVVWEPIDDTHSIYLQNYLTIDKYVESLKQQYKDMTGKSDEEVEHDFLINSPLFEQLVSLVKTFTNSKIEATSSIRASLNNKNWDDKAMHDVAILRTILSQIRVPKYVENKNNNIIIQIDNNLDLYYALLQAKSSIIQAQVDKQLAENKLKKLLEILEEYVPSDFKIEESALVDPIDGVLLK